MKIIAQGKKPCKCRFAQPLFVLRTSDDSVRIRYDDKNTGPTEVSDRLLKEAYFIAFLSAFINPSNSFDLLGIDTNVVYPLMHVDRGMSRTRSPAFPDDELPRSIERQSVHEIVEPRTDDGDRLFGTPETRISTLSDIVTSSTETPIVVAGPTGRVLRRILSPIRLMFGDRNEKRSCLRILFRNIRYHGFNRASLDHLSDFPLEPGLHVRSRLGSQCRCLDGISRSRSVRENQKGEEADGNQKRRKIQDTLVHDWFFLFVIVFLDDRRRSFHIFLFAFFPLWKGYERILHIKRPAHPVFAFLFICVQYSMPGRKTQDLLEIL